jgi:hypothetical protein
MGDWKVNKDAVADGIRKGSRRLIYHPVPLNKYPGSAVLARRRS